VDVVGFKLNDLVLETVVHSKGEAIVLSNPFSDGSSDLLPKIFALEQLKPLKSVDEFLTIAIEGEHTSLSDVVHLFHLVFLQQRKR